MHELYASLRGLNKQAHYTTPQLRSVIKLNCCFYYNTVPKQNTPEVRISLLSKTPYSTYENKGQFMIAEGTSLSLPHHTKQTRDSNNSPVLLVYFLNKHRYNYLRATVRENTERKWNNTCHRTKYKDMKVI